MAMQAELENEWPGPVYFIYLAYTCEHGKDLQLSEQARMLMHLFFWIVNLQCGNESMPVMVTRKLQLQLKFFTATGYSI
jgi:hypothetical protein